MADLSVLVTQEAPKPREFIYGTTRYVQSQNALSAGLRDVQVKLADTVLGPTLTPLLAAPAVESLKIATSGQVDLYGLGASVKVQDTVTVALFSGLAVTVSESLKVQDTVSVSPLDLATPVSADALKVSASGTVELLSGPVLHITDLVTAQIAGPAGDLSVTVATEAALLIDNVYGDASERLGDEALHVQDTVSQTLTPEQTPVLLESLKVQDAVTPSITPEQASGFDELLHVQDVVTASMGGLSVPVAQEVGKLADTVLTNLDPIIALSLESLTVADAVTSMLNPLLAVVAESLKVQDQVFTGGDLLVVLPSGESLKIADTVTPLLNPLFAATVSELLHVQDQVLTGGDLNVILTVGESGKLADTSAQTLDPLQTPITEVTVKTSDSLTAQLDTLLASLTGELVHVQDAVFTGGDLLVTLIEPLKLADTVTTLLTPLQTSGFDELLHVQDQVLTGAGLAALVPADALKVADLVTVARDLEATVSESLKLADPATPAIWLATSLPTEALTLADSVTASLTVLTVTGQEALKISEALIIFGDLLSIVIASEALHLTDIFFVPAAPEPIWICRVPDTDWTCIVGASVRVCQVDLVGVV